MELSELRSKIIDAFRGSPADLEHVLEIVERDISVFPFNEYEHLICNLIELKGLTYQDYIAIRTEYVYENPNLWIFEISAPRGFGEKFAQTYVLAKCPELKIGHKNSDDNFSGEYDLWLNGIRIEVKASRAVDSGSEEPLYIKALARNTDRPFLMNFQQLKPQCCDVFIWVAVFRDEIVLWVMSSSEVSQNALFSNGQHRGNSGNEGQLHVKHDNVHLLAPFELGANDLGDAIRAAAKR
jgi:hypothetical protein